MFCLLLHYLYSEGPLMGRRVHTEHALASAFGNLVAHFEVDGVVRKEVGHQGRGYQKMRHDGQSS